MAARNFFRDQREEIGCTVEFQRIESLPRRTCSDEELENIRVELTRALRRPGGTMELRTAQAHALHDIGLANGGVMIMRVGSGKTIVSLLAAAMLDPEPRRPVLITKAALVEKTKFDMGRLKPHWLLPSGLQIVSYEMLGRVSGSDFLDLTCRPDFIILDECHLAKNKKAGVVRRLVRYLEQHPTTRVVILSGTLLKASLRDAAHLISWALKKNAPVPLHENEVRAWADALDAASRVNVLQRHKPGALLRLATPEERATLEPITAARKGFQRRLVETLGVVATGGDQVDCSLNIIGEKYPVGAATDANFTKLRETWATPDDWPLMQAIEVWACALQLALGFHMVWDPRPPGDWRAYRKIWAQFVRKVLKDTRHLDTPYQVELACKEGALDRSAFDDWDRIRPTFTPRPKAVWHDDSALKFCQAWMEKTPGIVWTRHSFFAQELSRRTGMQYFGREGVDANGNSLDELAQKVLDGDEKPRPIIASMKANQTGRNLQGWNENLVTSPPEAGAPDWEQLLGRTHRDLQRSDEVNVTNLFGCFESLDSWDKSVELAQATQDTEGSSQKLCIATCTVPPVRFLPGLRWQKTEEEQASKLPRSIVA